MILYVVFLFLPYVFSLRLAVIGGHSQLGRSVIHYGIGRGWMMSAVVPKKILGTLDLECPCMTAHQFMQRKSVDYIVCDAMLVRRDALDVMFREYGTERIFLIHSVEEALQILKDIP